jgi:SAM-dependent methyltransferase
MTGWAGKYGSEARAKADVDHAGRVASLRIVLRHAEPGMRVLEAGSGTGRLSVRLARDRPVEVLGVDSSPEAIKMSTELAADSAPLEGRAEFVCGDLYRLPFPDSSLDIAFSDSVFEHLDDPAGALAELRRVLRPGGIVVLSVPNRWRPDGWDLYRVLARPPYRQDSFSPLRLRAVVAGAGFEPVELFGDELWLERNLRLLRRRLRRAGEQAPPDSADAATGPARASALRRGLARWGERLLPAWLHVNIGVVARRP